MVRPISLNEHPCFGADCQSIQEIDVQIERLSSGDPTEMAEAMQYFQSHEVPEDKREVVIAASREASCVMSEHLKKMTASLPVMKNGSLKFQEWAIPECQTIDRVINQLHLPNEQTRRAALFQLAHMVANSSKFDGDAVKQVFETEQENILEALNSVIQAVDAATTPDWDTLLCAFRVFRFGVEINSAEAKKYMTAALGALLTVKTGEVPLIAHLLVRGASTILNETNYLLEAIVDTFAPSELDRELSLLLETNQPEILAAVKTLQAIAKDPNAEGQEIAIFFLTKTSLGATFLSDIQGLKEEMKGYQSGADICKTLAGTGPQRDRLKNICENLSRVCNEKIMGPGSQNEMDACHKEAIEYIRRAKRRRDNLNEQRDWFEPRDALIVKYGKGDMVVKVAYVHPWVDVGIGMTDSKFDNSEILDIDGPAHFLLRLGFFEESKELGGYVAYANGEANISGPGDEDVGGHFYGGLYAQGHTLFSSRWLGYVNVSGDFHYFRNRLVAGLIGGLAKNDFWLLGGTLAVGGAYFLNRHLSVGGELAVPLTLPSDEGYSEGTKVDLSYVSADKERNSIIPHLRFFAAYHF